MSDESEKKSAVFILTKKHLSLFHSHPNTSRVSPKPQQPQGDLQVSEKNLLLERRPLKNFRVQDVHQASYFPPHTCCSGAVCESVCSDAEDDESFV